MARSKTLKSQPTTSTSPLAKNKAVHSSTGAPSQLNQSSRKGKRAWRKNVDIQDVEDALEGMRAEERVTGTTLEKLSDKELFAIDLEGDAKVRKSLPRFSSALLTSTKILSQRSAVPAVFSRSQKSMSTAIKRKLKLSPEEKNRLLRIAKRPRKGPFNSIIDHTQPGEGSALGETSAAVKASGAYDPWASTGGNKVEDDDESMGMETMKKKQIKRPPAPATKSLLSSIPAVTLPHQGTSYNPPVNSHQDLLRMAHSFEEKRAKEAEQGADIKEKMENAGVIGGGGPDAHVSTRQIEGLPSGMILDTHPQEDSEPEEQEEREDIPVKTPSQRKTKSQRNRAARLLTEKHTQTKLLAQKHFLASIPSSKQHLRAQARASHLRAQRIAAKRAALAERLRTHGLAGKKFGRHRVPEERVDVQLGEDLSESLRALKPEGNLFRDRFLKMQQRGAIEPRVPVLPRKRRTKVVEYEKYAWKRFK